MAFGRSGPSGVWRDRFTTVLMLAFGALAIHAALALKEHVRLSHVRTLLRSDMPLDVVVQESGADYARINDRTPGSMVPLAENLARGKTTIVLAASRHCIPSERMTAALQRLACLRSDLAVRRLEGDRPDSADIDFGSPLARELGIHAYPWLAVHDADGREVARGDAAKALVRAWHDAASATSR